MEARSQSEARQDLDSKLTPIRYDEIRHTAGESNARQQINVPTVNKHYFKPSFSALDCEPIRKITHTPFLHQKAIRIVKSTMIL